MFGSISPGNFIELNIVRLLFLEQIKSFNIIRNIKACKSNYCKLYSCKYASLTHIQTNKTVSEYC